VLNYENDLLAGVRFLALLRSSRAAGDEYNPAAAHRNAGRRSCGDQYRTGGCDGFHRFGAGSQA
jgi:hypothetical protein